MKRFFCNVALFVFSMTIFAQVSINETIKNFDEDLMKSQSTNAKVSIGFITYKDSNTCGSIVPYIQEKIKTAAEDSRRIDIVKTTELSEYEQAGIATRGLTMGMSKKARKNGAKNYIIDGNYRESGSDVELFLAMHDSDGNVLSTHTALISKNEISEKRLTLFPDNQNIADSIQKDFEHNQEEQIMQNKKSASKIELVASMLDLNGNLVNILNPNDIVRFKVFADSDCYVAILCIDANGVKTWLPTTSNFIEADTVRFFPDIAGAVLRISDDGVFGAEQVIIYACSDEKGLPSQNDSGKYSSEDLHSIMKKQRAVKKNKDFGTGTFKITYTIMEK